MRTHRKGPSATAEHALAAGVSGKTCPVVSGPLTELRKDSSGSHKKFRLYRIGTGKVTKQTAKTKFWRVEESDFQSHFNKLFKMSSFHQKIMSHENSKYGPFGGRG